MVVHRNKLNVLYPAPNGKILRFRDTYDLQFMTNLKGITIINRGDKLPTKHPYTSPKKSRKNRIIIDPNVTKEEFEAKVRKYLSQKHLVLAEEIMLELEKEVPFWKETP